MTSPRPHSPVLPFSPSLLLLLLLLHTHPAVGLPHTHTHTRPRRDCYSTADDRTAAAAKIALSVTALVLSIVAFALMLYNRCMRVREERYAARAHEQGAVEVEGDGDMKRAG